MLDRKANTMDAPTDRQTDRQTDKTYLAEQLNLFDLIAPKDTLIVRRAEYKEVVPFLLHIHYARRIPTICYAFALVLNGEIIGVVTYGIPASPSLCIGVAGEENRYKVLELNRLAILPKYNGQNYSSILVGRSLKELPDGTIVVSYADWGGWHHVGYVYQATNWLYTGLTKPRTDVYSEGGHSRHHDPNEKRRQARTEKHRYIYLCGSKSTKKKLRKQLRYTVYDKYPKGDSRHYDVEHPQAVISATDILME